MYGIDIETDTRVSGLDPAVSPVISAAIVGLGVEIVLDGPEPDLLRALDDAVAALERNTELQPMSPFGWYQLARVQMDRRRPDEARRIIRHLKGFEPKVAAQLEREVGQSV